MNDYTEDIDDLLDRAGELGHGRSKIALIEEAVNIADTHNDLDQSYELRKELLEAANFGGRSDLMISTFSWLLSHADADPERFDSNQLLWSYKWVVNSAQSFPTITKPQIESLMEDMRRRHEADGSTLHAYWHAQRYYAEHLGDLYLARHATEMLHSVHRDRLSNCTACVQESHIAYHQFLDEHEEALKASKPIFKGRMSCAEVPHRTHAYVLESLCRLGRHAEAVQHFKTGYRLVSQNPTFLSQQGKHILGLTLTDNVPRALTLLQRHWPESQVFTNPNCRFDFLRYVRVLLEHVRIKADTKFIQRVETIMSTKDSPRSFEEILRQYDIELTELATAFDTRNGTKEYQRRQSNCLELLEFVVPTPLKTEVE